MRKFVQKSMAASIGMVAGILPLAAEQPFRVLWHGTGGWGDKSAYCSLFNPKNVESVQGTIVAIDDVTPMPGMSPGLELQLKTATETIPVHLGPRWFLEHQDIDLASQDTVTVKGSRIVCEGKQIIAASEVHKGNQVIRLRDDKGIPLWTAGHQP